MLLFDQVQKLPFHDHNAPPLQVLVEFCKQATAWLNQSPDNVVTVNPTYAIFFLDQALA
jgi:hypothetical protein